MFLKFNRPSLLKSNIEAAKAKVSVNQKYADDAKVALDAAMAE